MRPGSAWIGDAEEQVGYVQSGTVLAGRYRVDNALGQGAFGQVWSAQDLSLERDVAIKVMLAEDADQDLLKRFEREAKVAARLRHPRILTVYDAGLHEGQWFIVMELLEGTDLAKVMVRSRAGLPVARAVQASASCFWTGWRRCMPRAWCIVTFSRPTCSSSQATS